MEVTAVQAKKIMIWKGIGFLPLRPFSKNPMAYRCHTPSPKFCDARGSFVHILRSSVLNLLGSKSPKRGKVL